MIIIYRGILIILGLILFLQNVQSQTNRYDSLVSLWYEKTLALQPNTTNDLRYLGRDSASLPDSVYIARLERIPTTLPLAYNELVRREILRYTKISWRESVNNLVGREMYYCPLFEEVLESQGLPQEIKYLPIIESAVKNEAMSRAKALGMWQFMPTTGRTFGMYGNKIYDERREPTRSTASAGKFLKGMNDRWYDDYLLSLAGYNCGPGNVNKAIVRAGGGKKNFWDIYEYLPGETKSYVPRFIAVTYLMHFYPEHGVNVNRHYLPFATDTIWIPARKTLSFNYLSEKLGVSASLLKDLNPMYKKDYIPVANKQLLRFPISVMQRAVKLKKEL